MKIKFIKSPLKNKKYRAIVGEKKIDFGDKRYQHYKDKIGMYSSLDHLDKKRRKNYRKRHGVIKLKDGRIAKDVKYTPAWFSWNYLW